VRIAIIGSSYPYKGGVAQHTTELARRLAGAGHQVRLESWSAQYPKFLYPGSQTIEAPEYELFEPTDRSLSWRRPDTWWRLGRRLRSSTDLVVLVVVSPVQVPAYLGILSGLRRGSARTLALCHNVLPHERRWIDQLLMRRLLGRVDAVLTHSDEQAEVARAMTTAPVATAPLAPHLPNTIRAQRPDAGAEHRSLLFFGIVRPYKGLDVLLAALAAGAPDVRLVVAGEFWGGVESYQQQVASLGLGDRVTLRPGYVVAEEVPALFAAADALVLPYRSATASQNTWLAFEHGVPVICTRTGSLPDQVTDGEDGLLCEPDDVAGLADALKRFYEPGMPQRLRMGVRPVDPEPYWKRYLGILVGTAHSVRPPGDPTLPGEVTRGGSPARPTDVG
jgi:glycosyltransferase involved in cell wall biosynthesis